MINGITEFISRYKGDAIQACITGADNFLVYMLKKKPARGPLYVGWNLTFRCNCKCPFCASNCFSEGQELTTKECLNIIRQLGERKVALLSLTGGEPMLRKDLFEIIKAGKKSRLNINLITNGSLIEQYAAELCSSGLDTLSISMDFASEAEHDKFRNHDGLFQKVICGIKKLKAMRYKNRPKIILGVVISSNNFNQLESIIEFWRSKADKVVFQPIRNDKTSVFRGTDEMMINLEEKERFISVLSNCKFKYGHFKNGYESNFANYFFNMKEMSNQYRCFAGYFIAQIDAYGNVYPCSDFIYEIGSLRKQNFSEIWSGDKIKKFRDIVKKNRNCFCWHRCTGPLNYYLTKATQLLKQ